MFPPKVLGNLLQHLPSKCQVCARWPAQPVCLSCTTRYRAAQHRCLTCARPLSSGNLRCGACVAERHPPALDTCLAALDYAYPWDQLIARFKFRGEPALAQPLARLMLEQPGVVTLLGRADFLMPVPVAKTRLAERGYNQAWELCKSLRSQAGARDVQGLPDGLVRMGHAPDQHNLPAERRINNLKNAFAVHPDHAAKLHGSQVLLVDDVSTTGTTLRTAAMALRQAGVRGVSAVVLARTHAD